MPRLYLTVPRYPVNVRVPSCPKIKVSKREARCIQLLSCTWHWQVQCMVEEHAPVNIRINSHICELRATTIERVSPRICSLSC